MNGAQAHSYWRHAPAAVALAGTATALAFALRAIAGVDWPHLYDALRDIGMAQSILHGRYPEDHILLGKTLWFNPLTAACVALFSATTGILPHKADVLLGPFLNLLMPLGMYLLARALFGRWPAAAAVLALLFVNALNREHNPYTIASSNIATYTPWLFAPHLTQGIFYLALLVYWKACHAKKLIWHVAAGVMLGLTFMGHTAPALILGAIMLTGALLDAAAALRTPRRLSQIAPVAARFILTMAVAFTASLPYTYSILSNYRFHILNWMPSRYVIYDLNIEHLGQFALDCLSLSTAVAAFGYICLMRASGRHVEKRIITAWLVFAWLFLLESFIAQLDESGAMIPQVVPGHHFTVLLSGAKALLAGYGAIRLAQFLWLHLRRWRPLAQCHEGWAGLAACLVLAAAALPAYPGWIEVAKKPIDRIMFRDDYAARNDVYQWLLNNTPPDAVFLTPDDDQLGLLAVAPAARKLVAAMWIFSNPYVNCAQRRGDREAMFGAINERNASRFQELAAQYSLTHILVHRQAAETINAAGFPFIQQAYSSGNLVVYSVSKTN